MSFQEFEEKVSKHFEDLLEFYIYLCNKARTQTKVEGVGSE